MHFLGDPAANPGLDVAQIYVYYFVMFIRVNYSHFALYYCNCYFCKIITSFPLIFIIDFVSLLTFQGLTQYYAHLFCTYNKINLI